MSEPGSDGARQRPLLTISQAAKAANVHRNTIRRRVDAGEFEGAVQVPENGQTVWKIPVEDLIAAGLRLHAPTIQLDDPTPERPAPEGEAPPGVGRGELAAALAEVAELRTEVDDARRQTQLARQERDIAQALATERAKTIAMLDDWRRSLAAGTIPLAIGASSSDGAASPQGTPQAAVGTPQPAAGPGGGVGEGRRRWPWSRRHT